MSNKIDTFINKYVNAQLSAFRQKKIQELLKKDDFKVITSNKVVTLKEDPSSTQIFNSNLVNDIKNLYIDKVIHAYNDEIENLVLIHSPKI